MSRLLKHNASGQDDANPRNADPGIFWVDCVTILPADVLSAFTARASAGKIVTFKANLNIPFESIFA